MNASQDKSKQIKKIVVKSEDELTDVLQSIGKSSEGRIQLTYTDFSDLLVSPINLKVIQEVADEQDKSLILQIINNPAGIRNAQEAGIVFTDSANIIDEGLWERAEHQKEERLRSTEDRLKKSRASGQMAPNQNAQNASTNKERSIQPPTSKQSGDKDTVEEMVDDISEELGLDDSKMQPSQETETSNTTQDPSELQSAEMPKEKSEYSKRVEQAIQKSKEVIEQGGVKVVKSGSLEIALDEDIDKIHSASNNEFTRENPTNDNSAQNSMKNTLGNEKRQNHGENNRQDKKMSFAGKDIMANTSANSLTSPQSINIGNSNVTEIKSKIAESTKNIRATLAGFWNRFLRFINSKGVKKGATYLLIPLILTLFFGFWLTLQLAPLVKVKAKVASIPVEVTKEFKGDPSVTEFDQEDGKLRVKKESVEQDLSDNREATGSAARGEKAGGSVTLKCSYGLPGDPVSSVDLPAGSTLTSNGKVYTTVNDVFLSCPTQTPVTVQAAQVGEEYNLESGSLFTIAGHSSDKLAGVNDGAALSGGTSETYTVISQQDVDDLSKDLQETAENEANTDFADLEVDGWILIKSTVKHELDGDIETDKPVGTEADQFNLSLKVTSTALYYNQADIEKITEEALLTAAQDKDLFENTDGDIELELDKNLEESITMEKVEDNKVTVNLEVSGSVVPKIDEEKIIDYLKGLKWKEGVEYLNSLEYFTTEPTVSFTPTWIPEGLWKFPSRQGRIFIDIKQVESNSSDSSSDTASE